MNYEEVLKLLEATYKDKGLPKKVLEVYARRIANTAETEEEAKTKVTELDDDLSIYQSFIDQNRTLVSEVKKLKSEKGGGNEPNPKPKEEETDEPKGADSELLKILKGMQESINELQTERKRSTQKEKLEAKLKELGVTKAFYEPFIQGKSFESDDEIEEFASSVKSSETAYLKSINFEKLKENGTPERGVFHSSKKGEASDVMKNYLNKGKNEKA